MIHWFASFNWECSSCYPTIPPMKRHCNKSTIKCCLINPPVMIQSLMMKKMNHFVEVLNWTRRGWNTWKRNFMASGSNGQVPTVSYPFQKGHWNLSHKNEYNKKKDYNNEKIGKRILLKESESSIRRRLWNLTDIDAGIADPVMNPSFIHRWVRWEIWATFVNKSTSTLEWFICYLRRYDGDSYEGCIDGILEADGKCCLMACDWGHQRALLDLS